MKVLIIRGVQGKTVSVHLNLWMKAVLSVCVFGAPLATGWWLGANQAGQIAPFFEDLNESLQSDIAAQRREVAETTREAEKNLQAISRKVAEMQSRLVRLEALGDRVAERAELDSGEFNFSDAPALGGPLDDLDDPGNQLSGALAHQLSSLDARLADRSMQLNLLSTLLIDRDLRDLTSPSGLPTKSGWISSPYGTRTDPFTGESAWHNGIDIAGREGSEVLAVASGVVTHAGQSSSYGNLIEVTHDNGLVTLYAHNKELLVELGSVVNKGQAIATMGSTGRSTGPHIHFEVYKNGRSVDPSSYVQRTIR